MTLTNLQVIRPTRKALRRGDVFAMQIPDGRYLFGQVVGVKLPADRAPMPDSNLIYIYRGLSDSMEPELQRLTPANLLIAPIFTNRLGWSKGYFHTVANRSLSADDLLAQHCFRLYTGDYLDLNGELLPEPVEPCGDWALTSYRGIDDEVSDALGIERVPEDGSD